MTNSEFTKTYSKKKSEIDYYTKKIESVIGEYCSDTHTYEGIQKNVSTWYKNKKTLIDILRKHPDWNEEAKSVVLQDEFIRTLNKLDAAEHLGALIYLTYDVQKPDKNYYRLLAEVQKNLSPYATKEIVDFANSYDFPLKINVGEKITRVINKLFKSYVSSNGQVYDMTTLKINGTSYEKVYAKLADSLSPSTEKRTAILSVNPLDYFLMSNGNSWSSCHNIRDGGWRAGTLSYMNDCNTMIFYTTANDDNEYEDSCLKFKTSRQVFVYQTGVLLQSRCYPRSDDDIIQHNRDLVKDIFDACLTPQEWTLEGVGARGISIKTHANSKQYKDYDSFRRVLTSPLRVTNKKLAIGNGGYCLDCGKLLKKTDSLSCCNNKVACSVCGKRHDRNDMYRFDNKWVCDECCFYCSYHERYEVGKGIMTDVDFDRVCEEYFDIATTECQHCGKTTLIKRAKSANGKTCCRSCFAEKYGLCRVCREPIIKNQLVDGVCVCCENKYCDKTCDDTVFKYAVIKEGLHLRIYVLKISGNVELHPYHARNGIEVRFGYWDTHNNGLITLNSNGRFDGYIENDCLAYKLMDAMKEYQSFIQQTYGIKNVASCH